MMSWKIDELDIIFPDLDDKSIRIKLDDTLSPKTFKVILDNLPVEVSINKWGEELYTDRTTITAHRKIMQRQKLMNWMLPTGPKEMHCVYFMDQLPLVRTGKYWHTLL